MVWPTLGSRTAKEQNRTELSGAPYHQWGPLSLDAAATPSLRHCLYRFGPLPFPPALPRRWLLRHWPVHAGVRELGFSVVHFICCEQASRQGECNSGDCDTPRLNKHVFPTRLQNRHLTVESYTVIYASNSYTYYY